MGSGGATALEARGVNRIYCCIGKVFGVRTKTRKVTTSRNRSKPTSLSDGEYLRIRKLVMPLKYTCLAAGRQARTSRSGKKGSYARKRGGMHEAFRKGEQETSP